ncbi:MAG TPA: DUF2975 domain-containing protein [Firmicutes bacterium]|nr:DUF2975 domain-containing protein [Bacillota bacterium]
MKTSQTARFLLGVLIAVAGITLFLCICIVPAFAEDCAQMFPEISFMRIPCLIFLYIAVLPFLFAVFKAICICWRVINENAFCLENARALTVISRCALFEMIWFLLGGIMLLICRMLYPGFILAGLVVIVAAAGFSTLCAVLSQLISNAADLQDEHNLTI